MSKQKKIIDEQFYALTHNVIDKLINSNLTKAEWKLWVYLTKIDSWGARYQNLPDTLTILQKVGRSKSTYYLALSKFQKLDLLPDWLEYKSTEDLIESQVRDRLYSKLGGLTEVTCPAGRIDLLTDKEIIEVKNIKDWKAALGQILVYSAY